MPTERKQRLLRESIVLQQAIEALGGDQSVQSIREWIRTNKPEFYDEQRIETLLHGLPNLRQPEFGDNFLERTQQGTFQLHDKFRDVSED